MAKQLNPMPPPAKTARRAIWVQALLALLLGGGFALAKSRGMDGLVPDLIDDDVYRAGVALGIGALVLLLLAFFTRYQWRLLWVLLLVIEIGVVGGLVWAGIEGFNWFAVIGLSIPSVVTFFALTGRIARRWFSH